jgi:hypothetical protein
MHGPQGAVLCEAKGTAMPIAVDLYDLLKAKLADVKIKVSMPDGKDEEKLLLEVVAGKEGWYEKFENAVKIQTANKDLADQRKTLEAEIKQHKADLKVIADERDGLKKGALSDKERSEYENLRAKGMTADAEARFNALKQQLDDATGKLTEVNGKLAETNTQVIEARKTSASEAQRSKIITELAKHGITGQRAGLAAVALLQEGKARIDVAADGKPSEVYRQFNKEGTELASTLDKVVKEFADGNEYLKEGTRTGGSGKDHRTTEAGASSGNNRNYGAMVGSEK